MDTITVDNSQGTGKLIFNGAKAAGFNGSGTFATVVFKIIATESGETELCTLWIPEITPTTPVVSTTFTPTTAPNVPTAIIPTALPQTGGETPKNMGTIVGLLFIAIATGIFFISKKQTYISHSHKEHKTHTKK
jgi:LPXTG-motif cell wall-anchored protein